MALDQPSLTDKSQAFDDDERARCERAQSGDRRALGELLTAHGPRLYRQVLLPRLGRQAAAQDALAATYLEAIKSLPSFRWQGVGVYPWLRQVALRVALRAIRKTAGECLFDPTDIARELEQAQQAELPALMDDRAGVRAHVERALEGLGPTHAESLRLRFFEERSREELAELWGLSLNAVDQRVHRAKAALQAALRAHGDARRASPLVFVLVDGGAGVTAHVFNRAKVTIGRAHEADLKLPGEGVSRLHATLSVEGSGYWLTDSGSSNGTLLRGQPLHGRAALSLNDSVRIGGYLLSVVETPLLSMWSRAILAEVADAPRPGATDSGPASTGAQAPTAPLSSLLGREPLAPADSRQSSPGEERLEQLLRAAWSSADVDAAFQTQAVGAVLSIVE